MAEAGGRVLIIDTDMRRPRLHRSFGVPNQTGISTVIVGKATLEEAIKRTDVPEPGRPALRPGPAQPVGAAAYRSLRCGARGMREALRPDHPRFAADVGGDRSGRSRQPGRWRRAGGQGGRDDARLGDARAPAARRRQGAPVRRRRQRHRLLEPGLRLRLLLPELLPYGYTYGNSPEQEASMARPEPADGDRAGHRCHRPAWLLRRRAAGAARRRRAGDWFVSRRLAARQGDDRSCPIGRSRRDLLDEYSLLSVLRGDPPRSHLQLRRAELHPVVVDAADLDGAVHRPRCRAAARGDSAGGPQLPRCCRPARASCSPARDCSPQDEDVADPSRCNPYGIAKVFAYQTVRAYRAQYEQFGTNVDLLHQRIACGAPRSSYFARSHARVAEIVAGKPRAALSSETWRPVRDWGYAPEYASTRDRAARAGCAGRLRARHR